MGEVTAWGPGTGCPKEAVAEVQEGDKGDLRPTQEVESVRSVEGQPQIWGERLAHPSCFWRTGDHPVQVGMGPKVRGWKGMYAAGLVCIRHGAERVNTAAPRKACWQGGGVSWNLEP